MPVGLAQFFIGAVRESGGGGVLRHIPSVHVAATVVNTYESFK